MKRLLAQLYYRTRMRYWRQRARQAERELKAERYRNMAREDAFVSASIMGQRGMFGVAPRTGPALQRQRAPEPTIAADPWATNLTGAEKLEFDTLWWPDAQLAQVDRATAQKQFYETVMQRRQPLNDEVFNH